MDEKQNQIGTEQDFYQTGSTQPPKSHSGVIALLLGLVIFLAGIVSFLGVQNIRLFRALQESNLSSLSDGESTGSTVTTGLETGQPGLGVRGEEVDTVSQHYYNIPAGIYVTEVSDRARTDGVCPGDILMDVNGTRVKTPDELTQAVRQCQIGDTATVTVYRDKKQLSLSLKVEACG